MKTIKQFLIDYSRDVISGEIVACEKHTWACERFLNNMDIHVTAEDQAHWDDTVRQFKAHNYNQDRHISAAERKVWNGSVSYANITLKNGAVAGTRTPIYTKWGPFLILRGHVKTEPEIIFGSIPAAYVPTGGAVVSIALSGTGGTANLIVYDNGDLKTKYLNPADSSKLSGGYYIDVPIGFQEGGTTWFRFMNTIKISF
ncbi:hypothetical protein [Bacillus atrophaeus]|uniref:hypothetical protein n=1 Tax=Bacillus atrophaeus TaxID=1452 RepID=UPI002EAF1AA7|nr:hypothetical protein [Bacillus atrophaeus]